MEGPRIWIMLLGTAWVLAWAGSFAGWWLVEPSGDGFTRGTNRIGVFLGWQAVAGMIAVALFGLGRRWPKGHSVRTWSRIPAALAALLVLAIAGFFVWALTSA